MMKHKHILTFNSVKKTFSIYKYSFGSTDGLELKICETGIQISAELTNLYNKDEMLSGNAYLFPDAIRKALLIYLLIYSKGLKISSITVSIDDKEETEVFNQTAKPPIYSMINTDLKRTLPLAFTSKPVIDYLLNTTKSNYGKRIASLFALLTSKSKEYETERFIYLWTSFNGIYGWLAGYIAKANNLDRYRRENKQIIGIQKFLSIGAETLEEGDKTRIANSVISVLKNYSVDDTNRRFFERKNVAENIEKQLVKKGNCKYNLSAYGYLLTQLSYYFRCRIVHGSKPIILFSYAGDTELHCLQILNKLLEEFIDEQLPLLFDESYIKDTVIPTTKNIKL